MNRYDNIYELYSINDNNIINEGNDEILNHINNTREINIRNSTNDKNILYDNSIKSVFKKNRELYKKIEDLETINKELIEKVYLLEKQVKSLQK